MRKLLALAVIGVCGCPSPSGTDGGAAGGSSVGGGSVAAGGSASAGGTGGSTAGGAAGGSVAPLITPSAYCAAYTTAQCDAEQRCGSLAAAQRASCLATRNLQCAAELTKLDAGAWRFDDVVAKRCLDGFAAQADAGYCSTVTFCDPWRPAGGVGAPCSFLECTEGTYCQPNTLGCRTCQPLKRPGEACDMFNSCGFGAFCPFTQPADDAGVRRCVPRIAEGAPCQTAFECVDGGFCVTPFDGGVARCSVPSPGVPCHFPEHCGSGRYCKDAVIDYQGLLVNAGTCQPRIALGQACTNQQEDDGCIEGTCLSGQCRVVRFTQPIGAECDENENCVGGAYCAERANAFPDGGTRARRGTCRARLGVDAGCSDTIFDFEPCQTGLSCSREFCQPLGREGDQCLAGCQSELVCGVTCVARAQRGQPCDVMIAGCSLELACVRAPGATTGVCGDRFALGTECRNDSECASSLCANLPDAGHACAPCR